MPSGVQAAGASRTPAAPRAVDPAVEAMTGRRRRRVASAASGACGSAQMSSMRGLPADAAGARWSGSDAARPADTVTPGARATSTMLPISPSDGRRCPQVVPSHSLMLDDVVARPRRSPRRPGTRRRARCRHPGCAWSWSAPRRPPGSRAAPRPRAGRPAPVEPTPSPPGRKRDYVATRRRAVRPDNVPPRAEFPPFQRTPAGRDRRQRTHRPWASRTVGAPLFVVGDGRGWGLQR